MPNRIRVVVRATGEVLGEFQDLYEADEFHEKWLDAHWDGENDDTYPACDFVPI